MRSAARRHNLPGERPQKSQQPEIEGQGRIAGFAVQEEPERSGGAKVACKGGLRHTPAPMKIRAHVPDAAVCARSLVREPRYVRFPARESETGRHIRLMAGLGLVDREVQHRRRVSGPLSHGRSIRMDP